MLISDQKKFIFLHNPKCAGTTVRKLLLPFEDRNNFYWMFDNLMGYKIDKAHMSLSTFRNFNSDDYKLLDTYFTFGFVRDPYARVISAFSETNGKLYNDYINNINPELYIEKLNNYCRKLTKKNTNGASVNNRHAIQQNKIFYIGGKLKADLIIKLEDLDSGLEKLNVIRPDIYSVLSAINTSKKNVKPIKDSYKDLLDSKSIDNVKNIYHDDFVLFDYKG